jgi:hypothetical protein
MLNKIKTRKVDFKSIVLSFDVENENLWHPKALAVFEKLKLNKFKIAISNISYDFDDEELFKNIHPNYLLFNLDNVTQEMLIKVK